MCMRSSTRYVLESSLKLSGPHERVGTTAGTTRLASTSLDHSATNVREYRMYNSVVGSLEEGSLIFELRLDVAAPL